jgi:hypothetical protein
MKHFLRLFPVLPLLVALTSSAAWADPSDGEMVSMLQVIDAPQRNSGDYEALVYIESKEKDKSDLVYQAQVFRRDSDEDLVILFVKPQSEAGKGYLRINQNLFMYDPTVGRWDRRTERERIGGTDSNRADFDQSRLAEEYTPAFVGEETLGKYKARHLRLEVKPGFDVAFPILEIWVDEDSGNQLKRQDFSLSGRLMRTAYYPEWIKQYSSSKGAEVYHPHEIRIFDEIEKGSSTTIVIQEVKLDSLPDNIFTKSWLESKSR